MPRYEFRMLCMNNEKSCNFVKNIMNDFDSVENIDMLGFDHRGYRNFDTDRSAKIRLKEIIDKSGAHLLDSGIIKICS